MPDENWQDGRNGNDLIRALGRGLEVLRLFDAERPEISLTEAAELADLPLPTAQRVMNKLEAHGFVTRTAPRGPYRLGAATAPGPASVWISNRARSRRPVRAHTGRGNGESANLGVLDGSSVLYLVSSAGSRLLTINTAPGLRLPAHSTALGKCLLSQLPEAQARAALGARAVSRFQAPHAHALARVEASDRRSSSCRVRALDRRVRTGALLLLGSGQCAVAWARGGQRLGTHVALESYPRQPQRASCSATGRRGHLGRSARAWRLRAA
jgi:IclR family pca regulon transcriptional regulator